MSKLIYGDLSYELNGIFYAVHNCLGFGHREKAYCQAIIKALMKKKINFVYQFKIPLFYLNEQIGKRFADFLIEDKIVVEIKTKNRVRDRDFKQLNEYVNFAGYKLGLLVIFKEDEVKIYRILNDPEYKK